MEKNLRKVLIALLLVLIGVVSFMFFGDMAMAPENHAKTIAAIDEKTETVLKLTGVSTLASAGVSAIPGDTATPIADKLADFTEYFLLILCVLYSEKYLLTIIGAGAFKVLIPCSCALLIIGLFRNPKMFNRLAVKFTVLGLALYLVIPLSITMSDMIYDNYKDSIETTIASAEALSDETSILSEAQEDEGLIQSILNRISETADSLTDKAANILNRFVETLAVMIVTSCIIPILVLVFFVWIVKMITGIDLSDSFPGRHGRRSPRHQETASD